MHRTRLAFGIAASLAVAPAFAAAWNTPESRARWDTLRNAVYGKEAGRLEDAGNRLTIHSPEVAQDAALVPVTLDIAPDVGARELDLVIDQNPSPVAAKIAFGPAADPRKFAMRVRVDAFTNMHAVVRTPDGKLLQSVAFVQGAGGCSAPMGMSVDEASAGMGAMRLKFGKDDTLGGARKATLMIKHPNFNGMQMDPAKHALTPSRYIQSIAVTQGGATVFSLETDISLARNPVLEFLYKPGNTKPFKVTVTDSAKATWTQQFDPPPDDAQAAR